MSTSPHGLTLLEWESTRENILESIHKTIIIKYQTLCPIFQSISFWMLIGPTTRKFPLLHCITPWAQKKTLRQRAKCRQFTCEVQKALAGNEEVSQGKGGSSQGCVIESASTVGNWSLVVPGTGRNRNTHFKVTHPREKVPSGLGWGYSGIFSIPPF